MVGMVSRSDVRKPGDASPLRGLGRRMVDLVCSSCSERLGTVTDEPTEPWFTHWAPTRSVRGDNTGEPFYTVEWGNLPEPTTGVIVHCFDHGHATVDGQRLRDAVDRYRQRGRTVRVVVEAHRD